MEYRFLNAKVYTNGTFKDQCFHFSDGTGAGESVFSKEYVVFPGFCDVHVHFRQPGFSYKETIATGSRSAARGGYTDVCTMPNLSPVPDTPDHLREQLDIIRQDALIGVHPYGAITLEEKGRELVDFSALAPQVCAFSDDGRGVQSADMMRQAMQSAKGLGKLIAAHCEVNELVRGGVIHDGAYAKAHGHKGICSESEWQQVARDIALAKETGCAYHVCHISTKESVELIRRAKAEGVNITCETGPHYLVFCEEDLQEDGRFKMNPPLRSREDQKALLEGILDGTIDMIATDHAPHSAEEKSRGLDGSAMGVVGLETAFAALYTHLVRPGILPLERLVELFSCNPRARFGLPAGEDFTLWDLQQDYTVDPAEFLTMGKATPFTGMQLYGRCLMTVHHGQIVWMDEEALA